ncbi:MAG: hypothetical protein QOE35_3504 [Actinomycetota bacterium]|jgi:hypothetical protein
MRPGTVSVELKRLAGRFGEIRRGQGVTAALRETSEVIYGYAAFPLYRSNRSPDAFEFGGHSIPYFRHPYNRAWQNERSVELALAFELLDLSPPRRVLEIGNVLSHYRAFAHDIVDKYERGPAVTNEDVLEFHPAQPYDVVVSISTLEHVGWDEEPREPEKAGLAVDAVSALVRAEGALLVTLPIGYNPQIDALIEHGTSDMPTVGFLKRISRDNRWCEVSKSEALRCSYAAPYRGANAVFVGGRNLGRPS